MIDAYEKVPFVWNEPQPPVSVPSRLSFEAVTTSGLEPVTLLIARCMAVSLDRADQQAIRRHGLEQAVARFVADATDGFSYQPEWWQLARDRSGQSVGFILPVIFTDSQREGRDEATIYYMGVVPEQRGKRYGYDLLCQATLVLQTVGVWRIFCDTDVQNTPMIHSFQAVGYHQAGAPYQRPL